VQKSQETNGFEGVFENSTATKKIIGKRIVAFYKIRKKIREIQENSIEMHLMSESNRNFLKTRKSAEFAELSAE
jgi:hypothetical protein